MLNHDKNHQWFDLIWLLTKRELTSKYKGSYLGAVWLILNPIFTVIMFTVLFSVVFKARWGGIEDPISYGVLVYAGLTIHTFFIDSLSRSSNCISDNGNLAKKVIFPLITLPTVITLSSFIQLLISIAILLLAGLVTGFTLTWTVIFAPLVLAPIVFITFGLALLLSSLGVFIRDIHQFMPFIGNIFLFTSPILFPIEIMPIAMQEMMYLNPLTGVVERLREITLFGNIPDWSNYMATILISLAILIIGWSWFEKTKKGFADVI